MQKTILTGCFALINICLFAQTEGNVFFGSPAVHTIKFTFPYVNVTDSLSWSYANDTYIKGDVEVDGTLYTNCGVKWKGNSSYTFPGNKKSFKIDFNEFVTGQDHDGLKKMNLNNCFKDPSFLREKLMLDFLVEHNLPAPRCTYAEVYINNVLWGLYTDVEEIDKTFLERWFGEKKGNLFKGDPNGDLKWFGSAPSSYYSKYELKTNESENDWTDIVQLINIINNAPSGIYQDTLESFFDAQTYLYTWATHILFANLDSYPGSGHNYYLYHDSTANKFRFISWDVNEAFGNFNMGMTIPTLENLAVTYIPSPVTNRPLHNNMLANGYEQPLYDAMCDLINLDWSIWQMEYKIDSITNIIRPYVYADSMKFFTNANFEANIDNDIVVPGTPGGPNIAGIKSFLTNRRAAIAADMAAHSCVVGVNPVNEVSTFTMFPNPANNQLTVTGYAQNSTLIITDVTGKMVMNSTIAGNRFMVDISALPAGIYCVNLKNTKFGLNTTKTLIKN
ncbi:MAG TPA: CotH kinase family protein [Flavobacteriales bacterium]|nr:CotH kinase family protein [Flavobacteriales bacterium]